MKVKEFLKRYSAASNGTIAVDVRSGDAKGLHTFDASGIDGLLERKAPITELTVGLFYLIDNELTIIAN